MNAVKNGDMQTAQEMVDEAARNSGYDTGYLVYRTDSGPYTTLKTRSEIMEEDYDGDGGNLGDGLYFTPDIQYAERIKNSMRGSVMRKFYLKADYADIRQKGSEARNLLNAIRKEMLDFDGFIESDESYRMLKQQLGKNVVKAKFSLAISIDGQPYVQVDTDQDIFANAPLSQYQKIARDYIIKKFQGKTVNGVTFTRRSANQYTHPANIRIDHQIKSYKMQASTQLDNFVRAGRNYRNVQNLQPDKHPQATGGFDHYDVTFRIDGHIFEGLMSIIVLDDYKKFHDITKIKDVTSVHQAFIPDSDVTSSVNTISQETGEINNENDIISYSLASLATLQITRMQKPARISMTNASTTRTRCWRRWVNRLPRPKAIAKAPCPGGQGVV